MSASLLACKPHSYKKRILSHLTHLTHWWSDIWQGCIETLILFGIYFFFMRIPAHFSFSQSLFTLRWSHPLITRSFSHSWAQVHRFLVSYVKCHFCFILSILVSIFLSLVAFWSTLYILTTIFIYSSSYKCHFVITCSVFIGSLQSMTFHLLVMIVTGYMNTWNLFISLLLFYWLVMIITYSFLIFSLSYWT